MTDPLPSKGTTKVRPFPLWELMASDLRMAWWNVRMRYTKPFGNYDHWGAVRMFLKSALVRPYYHWKTRHEYR